MSESKEKHPRERLNETLSTEELIADVERYGFECEGGPLTNSFIWTEVKRRLRAVEEKR